jgi:hypothetical protein
MISIYTDAVASSAALVLPVVAIAAATVVAAARASVVGVPTVPARQAARLHMTDLVVRGWFGATTPSAKRTSGTSYDPQSRGSTG